MSKPGQVPVRMLCIGLSVFALDTRKLPPRDLSRIGNMRFDLEEEEPYALARFYDATESHLARIAELHNAKLARERGSSHHVALQQQMRDEARLVIGDTAFERFTPGWVDEEMSPLNGDDSLRNKAMWACYQVVDAIDVLAQELCNDTGMLMGNYHQALFRWWQLVEENGLDAVTEAIGARRPLLN
ncbi:hypothetical protein CY658_03250 [Variovorax sp. RO1]|uniref:hypothetical protein n=1 Tax=Variovorax sp. RO1 TaxID=2066034 RepID=UPI000CBEE940|nr:hypothetical protein [Variovorax sp. RO1]PLC06071.1 hypothetical protein CY658_03250 [Variovorax sp. RO1]